MTRFSRAAAVAQMLRTPLIPVFFHADAAYAEQVLTACYAGGLRVFEFTNRGPGAFEVFAHLRQRAYVDFPNLLLGAGTIYTPAEAVRFVAAGADFIVQPVIGAEVAAVCREHEVAWLPGALTPNEVFQATQLGADVVKIFPASAVGPDYIRALRGPLPDVKLMVTGGIEPQPDTLAAWFRAGVNCVGVGSQLFKTENQTDLAAQIGALLAGVQTLPTN